MCQAYHMNLLENDKMEVKILKYTITCGLLMVAWKFVSTFCFFHNSSKQIEKKQSAKTWSQWGILQHSNLIMYPLYRAKGPSHLTMSPATANVDFLGPVLVITLVLTRQKHRNTKNIYTPSYEIFAPSCENNHENIDILTKT